MLSINALFRSIMAHFEVLAHFEILTYLRHLYSDFKLPCGTCVHVGSLCLIWLVKLKPVMKRLITN